MEIANKISQAVVAGIKELYGQEVGADSVQLQETRPEFEGNVTLVVFPYLRMSKKRPEQTAQEIGQYLAKEVPDMVAKFNVVKGFLNLVIAPAQWIDRKSVV